MSTSREIPQPPLRPIVGNLSSVDPQASVQSLMALAKEYGSFFRLKIINREILVASSQVLVDELCDENRFKKRVHSSLEEIRAFAGDGLFTAYNDEPNWAIAHRLLMPAFGPIGVRAMFEKMVDIADQMFVRWERFGPSAPIDVTDNMTRLTLDTIALCAFDTRFNSFYQNEMHPFVAAMARALEEAGHRRSRLGIVNNLMLSKARQYEADQTLMRKVAQDLIDERRRDPRGAEKHDLLNTMLNGVDTVTDSKLSDENIGYQLVTFLIAGHETTSGLLSFATYLLLKNPDVLARARKAVDEAIGTRLPVVEDLAHLRYIEQILMEALRIWPTAPAFAVSPLEDTTIGGTYSVKKGEAIFVLIPTLHRDPAVWGDDAETFRPERFAPDVAENLPSNAWKPFGSGSRACIGRPFAMQEAQLVLAMMIQRFDLVLDDPAYQLKIHETLTIKPEGLRIRARSRADRGPLTRSLVPDAPPRRLSEAAVLPAAGSGTPLLVLFGSNTGSCEAFAGRIANEAAANGFAPTLATMDELAGRLPKDGAVVVVTASYEGQPPDNARQFTTYIEGLKSGDLQGLAFAVFGCGNRQWARTYQAVPKRVDAALEKAGAVRMMRRGEADSGGDFFGTFDEWYGEFWPAAAAAFGKKALEPSTADQLEVDVVSGGRESALRLLEHRYGTIVENRELVDLSKRGARSKRHVGIRLPEGMTYRSGDYLAVLARNPAETVDRVLRRFGLAKETQIIVRRSSSGTSALPLDTPVAVGALLADYVELGQPATRAQVTTFAVSARDVGERERLGELANDGYESEILEKRVSALDLLERFPSCSTSFAQFLSMLPPMRARQYSISSSHLWKQDQVTLTIAVVDAPAFSGEGQFLGVASTHLAGARAGDSISVAVRPSNLRFHPPEDPSTPIVMICAGSGVAPFRGFLQERVAQKTAGQSVGPAMLFFGVDAPDVDFLYREELAEWAALGVVEVFPAFSEAPEGDVRFVQDRVWAERARISALFERGATVYVCGDGRRMAPAVRESLIRIYQEATGVTSDIAQAWADEVEHERGRYVSDVFA